MAAVTESNVCAVICAGVINDLEWLRDEVSRCAEVICADAGYLHAQAAGIVPDAVIGDFDSAPSPEGLNVVKYPARKDYTDASLAISYAMSIGYSDFRVYGATKGPRLDHTIANLVMCSAFLRQGISIKLIDENNEAFMALPGTLRIEKRQGKLSLFAYSGTVRGLTERGVSYPLTDFTLTADNALGVSNEIVEDNAVISFSQGILLVILSKD